MKKAPSALVVAALPVMLLAPAASEGQEPTLNPLASDTFRCGTTVAVPDGAPPLIDYQVVEAPSGTTTEIGVLFVYVDGFQRSFVEASVDEWVRTANGLFRNGTSGIRLTVAGVRSAPSSVNRASRTDENLSGLLEAAISADSTIRRQRAEVGGDIVTVVALETETDSFGGIARAWLNHMTGSEMKRQAYNVVRLRTFGDVRYRQAEGLVLAHEVGHNLGLVHDWQTLLDDHGRNPASNPHPDVLKTRLWDSAGFGYVNPDEQVGQCLTPSCYLGTTMSVADWYLMGFSRPSGSLPAFLAEHVRLDAGNSTTNADRALRRTAAAVADFYETPSGGDPPPDDEDDDPPPDDGSCRLEDGTVFDCHYTAAGHSFGVRYWHESRWKWAEIAVRSGDSAVFHFFGPHNLEVFVKVLDGCHIDGSVWVYASGLTDLPIYLSVWPPELGKSTGFRVPDGGVLRPQNGGRLQWCGR